MSRILFQTKIFKYECIEKRPIVYLDESGFALDNPRNEGYSLKGERCYACKDWQAKGRINAIGAIIDFKFINVCLFDGYSNADIFYTWVTKELLPNTPDNSVIVLDNATFHKRNDALQAIQQAGHTVKFLPPYSPNLNLIEKKWAQRKKFNYTPDELFLLVEL